MNYEIMLSMYLNQNRTDMRQAARISVGVAEAFSEVTSLEMLESLAIDPIQAQFQYERLQASAKLNTQRNQAKGAHS